ncbi:MAG TPA: restriction endonuclease subunit S [Methylomirabilota bacterium]|nr:restriction endonuclease subunit S [Methylomirabilota bacterium]
MATDKIYAGTPESWRKASLRDLCLKTEIDDPTKSPHRSFQYVDVSSVSNQLGKIMSSTEHTGSTAPSRARKLVRSNDVIFATVRPTLKRIALVPDHLDGQIVSTAFCVLRADPTLADSRFIYYSLLTDGFVERVGNLQRGASYPAVIDGDVLDQEILLPPVSEQHAIAEVLSKIQATIEVQDGIVATLNELKAATMAKLFREGSQGPGAKLRETQFGDVPEDWVTVPLVEVAHIQTGVAKGRRFGDESAIVELPYLRVANVQDGFLDLTEIKTIRLRETERQRYSLRSGDVLLTEGGDFDKLGRGYLWNGQIPDCVHQNHIFAVRTNRSKLLPEFFAYLAQSPYGKTYFLSVAHKTTNLACINSSKLKGFPVPLPPLSEQRKIATPPKKIDEAIDLQATRLRTLKSAFSSMLHLLMTGEIRLPGFGRKPNLDSSWFKPEDVWEFVGRLVRKFAPERVILFGSRAWGTPTRDSDVDLLVVMEFAGRPVDMAVRIGAECDDRFPMDLIVRRPAEIQRRIAMGDPFFKQILRDGLVLHERAA